MQNAGGCEKQSRTFRKTAETKNRAVERRVRRTVGPEPGLALRLRTGSLFDDTIFLLLLKSEGDEWGNLYANWGK